MSWETRKYRPHGGWVENTSKAHCNLEILHKSLRKSLHCTHFRAYLRTNREGRQHRSPAQMDVLQESGHVVDNDKMTARQTKMRTSRYFLMNKTSIRSSAVTTCASCQPYRCSVDERARLQAQGASDVQ
ncbi:hypothetical protein Tcan_15248 [Toxocara canis]|uniref:Uncharacterized protein n=1 Tax=Toxocara canis TaxID=6265 RepID=A0A0B2VE26_TOXCA|nr:hypothetical protein Tcan_15248 [Toxocara canis]